MDMTGETISHYRILEKLGRGGMGEVYRAEDTSLRRIVALKFLSPELTLSEDARTRFVHEAQAASALQHHNICTIHEIDRTPDGRMFICMDYYPGETLKKRTDRGALPVREAVDIAAQAAEGLAKAHEAGMVHRDVKPANIAVTHDGVVKILDFGLAMLSDRTRLTKMGTTVGTVSYMSPEQARGEDVTSRADVWSLGVILYEMLTGRLPFTATHDAALVYSILNETFPPVSDLRDDVPPRLVRVVDRALAKNPDDRYKDAAEMARDLREVAKELESAARAPAPAGPGADRGGRKPPKGVWLPLLLVAIIAAAMLLVRPLVFEDNVVSAPRPIAVIGFENRTGDPAYDYLCEAIPNLLITSLEQSKYLSVVTWERMRDLLERAGRGDVERIDRETGFEVCRMDGIDTIVLGSFARAGDVFVTDVKVLDVNSKELLKSASAKGDGVGSILDNQIDELGKEISRGVGLSERSIAAAGSQPIAAVTTTSMDAYHYFLRGQEESQKMYWQDARRSLERAVALDSTFAIAWSYLAEACQRLRDVNTSEEAYERAKALSTRAPEKERLLIEAMYAYRVENDEEESLRFLGELIARYPKEKQALLQQGTIYRNRNQFAEGEAAFKRVLELDPNDGPALNGIAYLYAAADDYERAIEYFGRYAAAFPGDANPYDSMAEMYFRLGRLDESVAMYQRALAIKPDFGSERGIAYIRALQEDYAGARSMIEQFMASSPSPGAKAGGRFMLSYYDLLSLKWEDAVESIELAEQAFDEMGNRMGIAGGLWIEAWFHYLMGDYGRSWACIDESYAITSAVDPTNPWYGLSREIHRGFIDLKEGLLEDAKARQGYLDTVLARVAVEDPGDLEMSKYLAALYRAEVLLAEGSIEECIGACRSLPEVGIPSMNTRSMFFYNYPCDRDVLARAYVRKGALDDAISEYERLITFDPASKDRRLVYPLFHYRLGVLYEETGQSEKALQQYEKFLDIVGDSAPGVPEVADARRREADLGQAGD
jgi:tetratricopeptide (TPR) repeat protein